jgi:hypothetical protein
MNAKINKERNLNLCNKSEPEIDEKPVVAWLLINSIWVLYIQNIILPRLNYAN